MIYDTTWRDLSEDWIIPNIPPKLPDEPIMDPPAPPADRKAAEL